MPRHHSFLLVVIALLSSLAAARAVEVPRTPPKTLKETQEPSAVEQHEKAAADLKPDATPVISPAWIEEIHQMVTGHSHRDSMPAEKFDIIFKKTGSVSRLLAQFPRDAKRSPNTADQNHAISSAVFEGKGEKLKLTPEGKVEGPDLYELFGIEQLKTVCAELAAIRRLQIAFTKNELNYALEAGVILAPDGKSWAWQIAPSEEQMPNVIYAMYYYPITRELHSTAIEKPKVAARVQRAAKEAGMELKWVKSMDDR